MQSTSLVPSSDPNHVLSEAKFDGGDVPIPKGKAAVAHTTRVTVSQTTVVVLSEDELRLAQLGCEYCDHRLFCVKNAHMWMMPRVSCCLLLRPQTSRR